MRVSTCFLSTSFCRAAAFFLACSAISALNLATHDDQLDIRGDPTAASLLLWADDFPLDVFLLVWSSASGTEAIHVILDVVVTELANL